MPKADKLPKRNKRLAKNCAWQAQVGEPKWRKGKLPLSSKFVPRIVPPYWNVLHNIELALLVASDEYNLDDKNAYEALQGRLPERERPSRNVFSPS